MARGASGDIVCVTPDVRALVAHDNAVAPHAGWSAAAGQLAAAAPPPPPNVYQKSAWSVWTLKDGVRYRYHWGWNSAIPAFAKSIDAIFEINNLTAMPWKGNARGSSRANTLGPNQNLTLLPNQNTTVSFKTDNCGTLEAPFFKGSVVRSSTY